MTANLTPPGANAVRLAMRAVHLARERDRARAIAVELEQRLARVEALKRGDDWQTAIADRMARSAPTRHALTDFTQQDVRSADLRAALEAPDA